MQKSYKFKLKPTKTQELELNQWLGSCRFVYNLCLDYKIDLYKKHGIKITKNEIQKELASIRNEYNWIGKVHSQTMQDVTDRLFKTYDSFFRGGGFPKFAKKDFYSSFAFKQKVVVLDDNKVKLPSFGTIAFRKNRSLPSKVNYATVKKEHDGWYICFVCEAGLQLLKPKTNTIGIDLGIKDFLVTSDGKKISNPKHLAKKETLLKKEQTSLSRKAKGSNNRKKKIKQIQILHAKVRNTRHDFLHKLSTQIVHENQVIVLEKLQVKNMVKNHKLAKSISDAGWSKFANMLSYKSEFWGRNFIQISPHNTSKDCSGCGWQNQNLTLSVREWICQNCGEIHDRDINAALNIRNKGILRFKEAGHAFSTYGDIVASMQLA